MSLIVVLYVPEGLVMAGDSRLTLNWKTNVGGIQQSNSITASDSNSKIFTIREKFGLGTFGNADINGIPIAGFINKFIEEKVGNETTIDEIPQLLLDFFGAYGNPNTTFYTCGYKIVAGVSIPHAYVVNIGNQTFNRINGADNAQVNGANWGGETEVLTRLLSTVTINQGGENITLQNTPVPWNFFTLQDAIDFAQYAVRTTIENTRFQQKIKTVGGPVDLLVIRPNEAPEWIAQKKLHI